MMRLAVVLILLMAMLIQPRLEGDINGDYRVDICDAAILGAHIGLLAQSMPECDLDGDGAITAEDMRILAEIYMLTTEHGERTVKGWVGQHR